MIGLTKSVDNLWELLPFQELAAATAAAGRVESKTFFTLTVYVATYMCVCMDIGKLCLCIVVSAQKYTRESRTITYLHFNPITYKHTYHTLLCTTCISHSYGSLVLVEKKQALISMLGRTW